MNRFRTMGAHRGAFYGFSILIALIFVSAGLAAESRLNRGQEISDEPDSPYHQRGEIIYADIDTAGQRVFVLVEEGLWEYRLKRKQWHFLDSLQAIPERFRKLEFGYNAHTNSLHLWSRGVGQVYEVDLDSFETRRVDQSHPHRNQFGHQPFFRDGLLYAFGGYGYWQWKNIVTFFNRELKEWNLHDIPPSSPLPEVRAPEVGTYVAPEQTFYMYGGESPDEGETDSPSTTRVARRDLWKFSFVEKRWEKVLELAETDNDFYSATLSERVDRINAVSKSFHSSASGIWYLPVAPKDRVDDVFYLTPIDLQAREVLPDIALPFAHSKDFLPSNFLFDERTQTVVVVGLDYLSTTERYPVRVIQIAEDSLLAGLPGSTFTASGSALLYLLGGILIVTAIVIVVRRRKRYAPNDDTPGLPLNRSGIRQLEWLNDQEKALVDMLRSAPRPLESQDLEEAIWPEVDSFDYRRKLRNDTIRSINKKFESKFPDRGRLVTRRKDPNDNRRYIYGLNSKIVQTP